jgi:diguanylate cyclase (GGDEF)-like protein
MSNEERGKEDRKAERLTRKRRAVKKEQGAMLFSKKREKKERELAKHIWKLLYRQEIPSLPEGLRMIPLAEDIHRELCEVRQTLQSYAAWGMDPVPASRNILAKYLRGMQGNFRHVILRIQSTLYEEAGSPDDFGETPRRPFNELARHLEEALQTKEEALREGSDRRQATIQELQEREYRFRYLASRDALTGALNRSSFYQRAVAELEAADAQKTGACIAMMDLDHFKKFNDRHGHLAGDEALKHVVAVVPGALRKTDFIGRYGGEEFTVFFPNTSLEICRLVCERVLKKLAATPVLLETGSAKITASIGLTQTGWDAEAAKEPGDSDFSAEWIYLLSQADLALYEAKKEGRNRVVSYYGERKGAMVLDAQAQER